MKTALVTGGTSGIGLCTAKELVKAGYSVYTFSRHGIGPAGMTHLAVDVTEDAAVMEAVDEILRRENRLDLVVHCAGFGISGAVEFTDTADVQHLFDVNFFGIVRVNRAVIPHLRQSNGRIIHVSSVAAPVAIPFQTYYSCTKAAVNDYSLALANELRPFGISVCSVMPGDIRTGFTSARKKTELGDDLYGGRIRRSVARMERDEQTGMSPEQAGKFLRRIADKRHVKPLYAIGFSYQCICLLVKLLPAAWVNRLVCQLYGK